MPRQVRSIVVATDFQKARRLLSRRDPVLRRVIQKVGEFTLQPQPGGYQVLVRSILSQQISTAAARTIQQRLKHLLQGGRIVAAAMDRLSDEQLQSAGISRQKRAYLRDLTRCCLDGSLNFRRISRADDERVIEELIQVKGIGRWTAQMYLMFSLGRPDVFAVDDLGLQCAMTELYQLPTQPDRRQLQQIADVWSPWRSMASWYLWRARDAGLTGRPD